MISAMKKRISNNKGLTLIELIIVIAIIGILAVIGVSQLGGMTESAKIASDEATANEIASAAKLYIVSNNIPAGEGGANHKFKAEILADADKNESNSELIDDVSLVSKKYAEKGEVGLGGIDVEYNETTGNVNVKVGELVVNPSSSEYQKADE